MALIQILIWLFLSFLSFILASHYRQESPKFSEFISSALLIGVVIEVVKYFFVVERLRDALEGEAMYVALFGGIAVLWQASRELSGYFGFGKDHRKEHISDGLREQILNLVENNSSLKNQSRRNKAIVDIANVLKREDREINVIELFKEFNKSYKRYKAAYHLKKGDYLAKNSIEEEIGTKELEKAEREYDKSTKTDPNNYVAWNQLGVVRERLEKYNEALNAYNQATQLKPDYSLAWYNQSVAMEKLESYEQEIICCENALRYCDNFVNSENSDHASECQEIYPSILINKGYALIKLERYSEALNCLEEALKLKLNHANTHYNLAYCYAEQGNLQLAIGKLKEAFRFDSSYQEILKKDQDFSEFKNRESSKFDQDFSEFLDQI